MLDLLSRRIVGWSMGERMTRELVCDAFSMAVRQRRPPAGLIVHTDRGSQYTSHDFKSMVAKQGAILSMSGVGNCYDNAVAESFFGTQKLERVHHVAYQTRAEAASDVFFYIEGFYNRKRQHTALNQLSPAEFEAAHAARPAVKSQGDLLRAVSIKPG